MARAPKIEPAITTDYQEHMADAAKVALRRLRRTNALDVSEALGEAFQKESSDERRRLVMATRLHLLNEQLLKLDESEQSKPKKPAKKSNPKPPPPPPEPEPEPEPEPAPKKPVKEATLNKLDLDNAAAMLMAGFGEAEPEEEAAPSGIDEMAALLASDDEPAADDPFAELNALESIDSSGANNTSDPFAELASLGDSDKANDEDPFAAFAELEAAEETPITDEDPFAALSELGTSEESKQEEDPFAALAEFADDTSEDAQSLDEDPFAALAELDSAPSDDHFAALQELGDDKDETES